MITVTVDRDFDDDGVLNAVDFCPGTVADEPFEGLGVNRWVWDGQDWITEPPKGKGKGPAFDVSMDDTMGCSCTQILDALRKLNTATSMRVTASSAARRASSKTG